MLIFILDVNEERFMKSRATTQKREQSGWGLLVEGQMPS